MSTTLHRAEDVAAELVRRLGLLTIAQGAETDIGTVVHQGRTKVDDEMMPCTVIIEADDTPADKRLRSTIEIAQRYVLFAYLKCDPDNPNVAAHAAIRDLKRANWKPGDDKWGGLVRSVEYIGRDIGPRADGAGFVVAAIEMVVTYVENIDNP